jgi:hypothetical protein
MIIATHGILASQLAGFDADAQAFFDRVTTAGGSLSTTEKTAVNKLVLDLKGYSIWTKMKAIYPMVGGGSGTTAARQAACSQNLKSSSFTGTFTATGWTYASTGVTPNGTSAYMDTGFNSNTNQTVNNFSLSVYVRTSTMSTGTLCDMGNANSPSYLPLTNIETDGSNRNLFCWDYNTTKISVSTTNASGMWGVSRSASNSWQSFERNTAVSRTTTTAQTSLPNLNIYIGAIAINTSSGAVAFANREICFGHLADALSNTEFNNFYTAVQAFQTTLSRNV